MADRRPRRALLGNLAHRVGGEGSSLSIRGLAALSASFWVAACATPPPAAASDAAASGASQCSDAGQPVLAGHVTGVVDGDTIDLALPSGPIRVRLSGADAPEHDQPWGPQATAALRSLVFNREVELVPVDQDRYDRMVAHVCVGPEDVGASLITQGDAWAYRRYLEDPAYCALEGVARAARRGVWSYPPSQWIAPWEWRAVQAGRSASHADYSNVTVAECVLQSTAESSRAGVGQCVIKGNVGKNGRIYHLPGSTSYDETRIDPSQGERWFCSEAEARAAGWRPARD